VPVEACAASTCLAKALEANGSIKVRSPRSRALHAARASPAAAQTANACLFASPACPSLALDPTRLSAFVRWLAQELDDFMSSEAWSWRFAWGSQPLGLGWGSQCFYVKTALL